jgi:hypothetical protein
MGIMKIIKPLAFILIAFNVQAANADDSCYSNCVMKERDGAVLIYKWLDETGKTKKIFTVDLPDDAKQSQTENRIKDTDSGVTTQDAPPAVNADGGFIFNTTTDVYITETELVMVVTTKIFDNRRGGMILHDVIVTVTRVKKPKVESIG